MLCGVHRQRYAIDSPRAIDPASGDTQEAPQKLSLEEVIEKYGLEAGLFNAIKDSAGSSDGNDGGEGGDAKSKMATAGDLLKRYGGVPAHLDVPRGRVLQPVLRASNGVDVAALISNIPASR